MSFKVEIPYAEIKPAYCLLNELYACKCFPDLVLSGIYPNLKEMTESAAAFRVMRSKYKVFELGDSSVTMIAVADGRSPRTGALFAFRSRWNCISIDPMLKGDYWRIKRLACISKKIENCPSSHYDKLVIACVHSHVKLDVVAEKFTANQRLIISIPCCVPQELDRKPDLEYHDKGVWSPMNKVKIWYDERI